LDREKIEQGVRLILEGIGEDPDREGLLDTPARVARAWEEVGAGIGADPAALFEVSFAADHDEVVLVRDIPFYSMCEHHLLPFFGVAHVAYLPGPDGRVCGISKLARCVELYARRPQLQERLTSQIADALVEHLAPKGVFVQVEAEHLCMTMRGVGKPGAVTLTRAARGAYADDPALYDRVAALVMAGGAL
jgi:GTP cyclohydrolase I